MIFKNREVMRGYLFALIQRYGLYAKMWQVIQLEQLSKEICA